MNNRDYKVTTDESAARISLRHSFVRYFVQRFPAGERENRYCIFWRRILLWALGSIFALYLGGVSAIFIFARYRRHIETIGFLDLALPSRWSHYRVAQGDHFATSAQKLFRDGRRSEAFVLAGMALNRSPANRDGRLLLAQLLAEDDRLDAARQALLDGLKFHRTDPTYLRPLLVLLFREQQDARIVAIARGLLTGAAIVGDARRLLVLAGATASYFQGDYDQADDFLRASPSLLLERDGRLLSAKIDWDRGSRDLALLQLRTLRVEFPDDNEIHAELSARLAQRELRDEERRLRLAFQIAHPTLVGPRIELLKIYHRAGERDHLIREAAAFLRDFPSDSSALLALANFAADTGNTALARTLNDHARTHHLSWEAHAILVTEALVVARDYHAAIEALRDLQRDNPRVTDRYPELFDSLRAIAHYGAGDIEAARLYLASFLNRPNLRAENLLATANRLADIGASEEALQTLLRAIATDPFNQIALTRLVELELNLNRIDELPAHLRRLVAMRRPSPEVLRVAQHKLGSDLFLFSTDRPAVLESIRMALEKIPAVAIED